MRSIVTKLAKNVPQRSALYQNVLLPLHFSYRYTFLMVCHKALRKLRLKKLANIVGIARDRWIQNYINKIIQPVLETYRFDSNPGQYMENAPVWVCWWTGLETAPELVQHCIRNIRRCAGSHPVHVITKDNFAQYIQLPEHILQKFDAGNIGIAHFSDCIRVNLLANHGGLWLDATMFPSGPIPEDYFSYPAFSCKGPVRESEFISDYRWVGFCLGGWKGNIFYRYLSDAFNLYWHTENLAVTYLFFDFIIKAAYDHIPAVREMLDDLPENNTHRDDLQKAFMAGLPADAWEQVLQEDTCLYKLNWKANPPLTTPEGNPTIFARFLEESK